MQTTNMLFTFLISGILGENRWEICEMTSWMSCWFFMVFRVAFMILYKKLLR